MSLLDSVNLHQSVARSLRHGQTVVSAEVGRVCTQPDCHTRLSRYNPATTCSVHLGWSDPIQPRRRGPRVDQPLT